VDSSDIQMNGGTFPMAINFGHGLAMRNSRFMEERFNYVA
jgi:hypothetical protein